MLTERFERAREDEVFLASEEAAQRWFSLCDRLGVGVGLEGDENLRAGAEGLLGAYLQKGLAARGLVVGRLERVAKPAATRAIKVKPVAEQNAELLAKMLTGQTNPQHVEVAGT